MKQRIQIKGIIIGFLIATLLFSSITTVIAATTSRKIDVYYDNYKIYIDGKEFKATDKNSVIEPFSYNGWIYAPFEHIAKALGKEARWDGKTNSLYLGGKEFTWLDQIGYYNYDTSGDRNIISSWETGSQGTNGIKYDRGIKFMLYYGDDYGKSGAKKNNDGTISSYQNVEYLLDGNYKSFKGTVLCAAGWLGNHQNAILKIYGDDSLLYTSPPLTSGSKATDFDLDISKYKILKINVSIPNLVWYENGEGSYIGIVDARLENK